MLTPWRLPAQTLVHLSREAREAEGFCRSQTNTTSRISLIRIAPTGKWANHRNQLPAAFVCLEHKLRWRNRCGGWVHVWAFVDFFFLPSPSWEVARRPASCWPPWCWTPSSARPCSTAYTGTPTWLVTSPSLCASSQRPSTRTPPTRSTVWSCATRWGSESACGCACPSVSGSLNMTACRVLTNCSGRGKLHAPPPHQDGRTCRLIRVRSSGGVCSDSCCTHCTLLLLFVYPAVFNNFSLPLNLPLSFPFLSHTPSRLHNPLTSFIDIALLTHFPSPRLTVTHFSQLLSHFLFFNTRSHTFVHPPRPTPPLFSCLISFVSSPRWTGRWTSSSPTAAWTSTTVCFRSCCNSNTWCGASARSGSTSREQVRRWELLIQAQIKLNHTAEKKLRFFLLCFSSYKIFIESNVAIPLCFIYTTHISCQWDWWKTLWVK